jgi:hypothetical protein
MRAFPWAAGAAGLALLTGCMKPEPMKPPKPADEPGKPMFGVIANKCPAIPPGLPVVKITITDVSPKKIGHDTALFEANKDGSASTDKRLRHIPEVLLQTQNPTRLDIDAREFLKKPGDLMLVEVVLADPDASFTGGAYALTSGNADGAAMFCVKDPIDPKPDDRTVRFYVQYQQGQNMKVGKYNLFLLLKDGPYATPILLDPKVHNSG